MDVSSFSRGQGFETRKGYLPERAVHVINVDSSEMPGELGWGKQFKLLEDLIRWFVLPIVASGVNEQPKGFVPQAASDLVIKNLVLPQNRTFVDLTNLQVAI